MGHHSAIWRKVPFLAVHNFQSITFPGRKRMAFLSSLVFFSGKPQQVHTCMRWGDKLLDLLVFLAYGNTTGRLLMQVNKIVLCHHHDACCPTVFPTNRCGLCGCFYMLTCVVLVYPADDAIILLSKTIICDDALIIAPKNSFEPRRYYYY